MDLDEILLAAPTFQDLDHGRKHLLKLFVTHANKTPPRSFALPPWPFTHSHPSDSRDAARALNFFILYPHAPPGRRRGPITKPVAKDE